MLNIVGMLIVGFFSWFSYKYIKGCRNFYNSFEYRPLDSQYWGTGDRYLVGDFITEDEFEEMRAKVNSPNSKF